MEMASSEVVNVPKSYSLNMSKDIVPMCIFSEADQGENFDLAFVFSNFLIFFYEYPSFYKYFYTL